MATSHFQRELIPPARTFYERELGTLSRPRRGWSLGRCPFHNSKSGKSFSVNLESGGFCCFGCGAHGGDVIAFLMLAFVARSHGLTMPTSSASGKFVSCLSNSRSKKYDDVSPQTGRPGRA